LKEKPGKNQHTEAVGPRPRRDGSRRGWDTLTRSFVALLNTYEPSVGASKEASTAGSDGDAGRAAAEAAVALAAGLELEGPPFFFFFFFFKKQP
jgi:hypothetical protein